MVVPGPEVKRSPSCSLHHSHSNSVSRVHRQPIQQLAAMWDPRPNWVQGSNPYPHEDDLRCLMGWAPKRPPIHRYINCIYIYNACVIYSYIHILRFFRGSAQSQRSGRWSRLQKIHQTTHSTLFIRKAFFFFLLILTLNFFLYSFKDYNLKDTSSAWKGLGKCY